MTPEKMKEVTAKYRGLLQEVPEREWRDDGLGLRNPSPREAHAHVKWMLDQVDSLVDQGKLEKAFRWLGFMQGVFWSLGTYSLSQMREHNRKQ